MFSLLGLMLGAAAVLGDPQLLYDSGDPQPRDDGAVAFVSTWKILDPIDDLAIGIVVPFELSTPAEITEFQFYSYNPKDPADKRIEIYAGTSETSPGALRRTLTFTRHQGTEEGWSSFVLSEPLRLPAGRYGVSFRAEFEFNGYWAANAPNGGGYAWVRLNETRPWFKGGAADFGFAPNFGTRIYGTPITPRKPAAGTVKGAGPSGGGPTEAPADAPSGGTQPAPTVSNTTLEGATSSAEYEPGNRPADLHVIWRKSRVSQSVAPQPADR